MRVLVVEDDSHSIDLMRVRLAKLQCEVRVASDPDEAYRVAVEAWPQLILLDLNLHGVVETDLPATDGMRLLARLRANPGTADIPVLIHSVFIGPRDPASLIPEADGFLTKPFKFAQLKELIERFAPSDGHSPAAPPGP